MTDNPGSLKALDAVPEDVQVNYQVEIWYKEEIIACMIGEYMFNFLKYEHK